MWVKCPNCNEEIGLTPPELEERVSSHGDQIAWFECHACQSRWSVRAKYVAVPDEDEDDK